MHIQPNQIISLGYGKFARSDEIISFEPVAENRGAGRRSLVWVRGLPSPVVSSRSTEAIARDLVRPDEALLRSQLQRTVLSRVAREIDEIPGSYRRSLREADGIDLDQLATEATRAIA
jgi:hypothetical protein